MKLKFKPREMTLQKRRCADTMSGNALPSRILENTFDRKKVLWVDGDGNPGGKSRDPIAFSEGGGYGSISRSSSDFSPVELIEKARLEGRAPCMAKVRA